MPAKSRHAAASFDPTVINISLLPLSYESRIKREWSRWINCQRLKIRVVWIDKVIVLAFNDGAWNLKQNRGLTGDPVVTNRKQLQRCRVNCPVTRKSAQIQTSHNYVIIMDVA